MSSIVHSQDDPLLTRAQALSRFQLGGAYLVSPREAWVSILEASRSCTLMKRVVCHRLPPQHRRSNALCLHMLPATFLCFAT